MSDTSSAAAASTVSKKRLALFLDGTWNEVNDNTNIWRFRSLCAAASADGCEQLAYYSTGLGTQFGEKVRGGMFGDGIDGAITSAYEWLIENYQPGDEIFIFGFSRGAYTARSLSGFITKYGLLQSGAPLGVNQLFKRYRDENPRTIYDLLKDSGDGKTDFTPEEKWILKFARAAPVKFIGVFDTVGALGVPFPLWRKLRGQAYPFLNTGLRHSNEYAFHAMAVDEHRKAFAPTLWSNEGAVHAAPRPIDHTEQRWFVGAHANIGGGYFDNPLAQLPFKWLAGKAQALGLAFHDGFAVDPNAAMAPVADSYGAFMWGWYRLFTFFRAYYRPIGLAPKSEGAGVTNINETIDVSVFDRWRADKTYRPPALSAWAKRVSADPSQITNTVRTDDPKVTVG